MRLIEFIRLLLKHKFLLGGVPVLLAALVFLLTSNPKYDYYSETMMFTGLATGSSIEMDKSFNYFATNIAFDNLINIVNSRDTQEEVAIRLLSQHLMLDGADPRYISEASYEAFMETVPEELFDLVVQSDEVADATTEVDSTVATELTALYPRTINRQAYEQTVANLTAYMMETNDNFVYELLNYEDDHYSIKAISEIKAVRMSNSDLVKLSYQVDDPGICQQTLAIFSEVCQRRYKGVKENGSDAVVKYFEEQLRLAEQKLKQAENTLLQFNKDYNIINYYEQSKAVAIVKEEMEVNYNTKKAELAGAIASTEVIEQKLKIQEQVQAKTQEVLDKKKRLGELNFEVAMLESADSDDENTQQRIKALEDESKQLDIDIRAGINELYSFQNSVEGVPLGKTLPDWMDNVVKSEDLKAKLDVMEDRNEEFKQQYSIYAPAGANLKRIEREIAVSEQGYLEILHGLNLAKLKSQDNELSSNLKTMDPPYYPLSPIPTKRKLLVIASLFIGFILLLALILGMEFFDNTLKNLKRSTKIIRVPALGLVSKVLHNPGKVNQDVVLQRLMQIIVQNLKRACRTEANTESTKTVMMLSTQDKEGKTVITQNTAKFLADQGKRVLVLNYEDVAYQSESKPGRYPILNRILGYSDTRVGVNNAFLKTTLTSINNIDCITYSDSDAFNAVGSYQEILEKAGISLEYTPDFVFIELKGLLNNNYPMDLVANADLSILVCRANRLWSEADSNMVENLKFLTKNKVQHVLNGVELEEVEPILGEFPKNRSASRRRIKDLLRLQFHARESI
ncbi:hypothetical protein [Gilvibacter sp.]|uniref:exopolysaccharide transport family protein n=1 Tax=Gilvibacter sp. TaxID=2729997 RepID=UPI0025C25A05|nr:hypothetical protein [Gilvibacter sp.]NQX76318.1 hypothetical protein [Gilvibacter sp.]